MTVVHVYAIVAASEDVPRLPTGVDGAPVGGIVTGELTALTSRHDAVSPEVTLDRVLAHEAVIEAAMHAGSVLPVRYGTRYADEDAVRSDVRDHAGELEAALQRVGRRVELALRLAAREWGAAPRDERRPGRSYLEARRTSNGGVGLLNELIAACEGAVVDAVVEAEGAGAKAALLVDADAVDTVGATLAGTATARRVAGLSLTGPWPPYSFVSARSAP